MAQILELEGYRVLEARTGAEALERIFDPTIRVALLDVMLPGIDGFEVCRRLRQDERTARLPVAFISARSRGEDRAAGLLAGADVYLTKPISRRGADLRRKVAPGSRPSSGRPRSGVLNTRP